MEIIKMPFMIGCCQNFYQNDDNSGRSKIIMKLSEKDEAFFGDMDVLSFIKFDKK